MINYLENKYREIFLDPWRPFIFLASIIFLVYSATLFFNIVYLDDNVLVVNDYFYNKNLSNLPSIFQEDIFRTPYQGGSFYRPILRLTFMLDAQFGESSIIFMAHLTNLLLHILAVCLLFLLLTKFGIKKETVLWLSLIFGIHPLTAQTVSFIPGRNDSLLAIFAFPAIWFFLDYVRAHKNRSYFWHLAFLVIALFTKETSVIVPVICFVYAIIFLGIKKILAEHRRYLYILASWASLYLGWFMIRKAVLSNFIGNADYHIVPSILKNLPALIPAIGKIFLPFNLSVFPVMQDMAMVYGVISLALLFVWLIFSKNKNYKLIIFGILWFGLFILPTLIKPMDKTADFSENRIYLPMIGFIFILLGLGRSKFMDLFNKKTFFILGSLLILVFSLITIFRNKYYENKISFWSNAVATSPSFAFNHNNLGAMYYLDGKYNIAEVKFKKALEINPVERLAHNNLGLIYAGRGDFESAIKEYGAELELNPYYGNTLYNMGLAYWSLGKKEDAVEKWQETINADPNYFNAYKLLIMYYQDSDQKDPANKLLLELQNRGGL